MTAQWGPIEREATARAKAYSVRWQCFRCGHKGKPETWTMAPALTCPKCGAHLVRLEVKRERQMLKGLVDAAVFGAFMVMLLALFCALWAVQPW